MASVPFIGGPYDGASFTFADRLPERINLQIDCLDADAADPKFREALRFNLSRDEIDGLVVMRNAQSVTSKYMLDSDMDGARYFRYEGWTVEGVRGKEHVA